ncbi:unnamed protein product, partial [Onchocerca ochengi]|uniref:Leishmanolysin-like peptidase n=1 Tax=Onchocerca ochengi TaxID=42157 RepID=A0A182E4G7_ONCOC
TSLLPEAVNYWQIALAVRPTAMPIRLYRKCISNLYYMRVYEKRQSCVLGCKNETSCGEVIIPDEHLYQCRYCISPDSQNCDITGPPDGIGVPNTDFLLYVSAVLSERCKNIDTVAYAAHCQQEAHLDRPIAGHVNLCPNALSTALHDREVLISTVKHEILHALGFSAGLYAFFRDDNGNPRTRRNRYNKPVSLNKEHGYYNWDQNTIQTIIRHDWWTAEGMISHPVHIMVTPRVQQEAQRHFNCSDLEGAELENQGGDGTAFTHWEKRLFENEAMTGTHTQNPVYSRLTLALLEDSGWYKPNYSAAEELLWGHHLGCEFAKKSCGEWIRNRREKNLLLAPFCNEIKHDGKRSLATTRCTAERDSLALCNLIPYRKPLPVEYRNFAFLDEIQDENAIYYGGSVELADYCPYNQEFEWKAPNSTERRDSRCELDGNFAPNQANSILEVYGNQSKCFDLATFWTERKCGHIRTFLQYKAGCYQYECSEGRLNIGLFNGSFFYPCYFTGQYIHIRKIINGWLREGVIICPSCEEICRPEHFSFDDKFGLCQETNKNEIPEYFLGNQLKKNGMSIVDEAIVWGKRSIDPWHRMTCCPEAIFTVIEFCQAQGPRPLYSYPANVRGPHLDMDSVALWLMSAEVINGSSMIIYNQQMDIYACVHYSTLLDLHARAFQRPLSLALLTPVKPTAAVFKEFIDASRHVFLPLLVCNQTLFKSDLIRLINVAKTVELKTPDKKNLLSSISKSAMIKIQSVADQAKRMLQRFENDGVKKIIHNSLYCNGHDLVNNDVKILEQFIDDPPLSLQEMKFLTPCTYDGFIKALPEVYEKLIKAAQLHSTGTLFCAAAPVLKLKDCNNHSLDDDSTSATSMNFLDENDYTRNLTTIVEGLDKILFALLSGEKLALWSVEERKSLGKDLLKKLNLLRICMQRQSAPWKKVHNNIEDCQLFGESVPRKTTVNDSKDAMLCVYDVEGRWLKCKNYKGKLLSFLSSKRSDSFPSDYALIQYVMAQLTELCSIVYLAKYSDPNELRERLQIEEDDFKMIINLLAEIDVLKYGWMKEKMKKENNLGMITVKI